MPPHDTICKWSGDKSAIVFDRTIVSVLTDTGLLNHGEGCPLGPFD